MLALILAFSLVTTTFAQDIKIGFVNSTTVLKQAPQAENARIKLETEFSPRDKKIIAMKKELEKLEKKLSRDAQVMNDSVKKKIERELISQKRDIKRAQEEFNEDLNIRRNEELNTLKQKVYEAIVSLAKEKNFDVILGDSVMFASKRVDITQDVIKSLKATSKTKK